MTEDETVLSLIEYLKNEGWKIDSHCLGHQRGDDIVVSRGISRMTVEAKGAKVYRQ